MNPREFTENIYSLLDDPEVTLVFPTENAARHHLAGYVRARGRSVLADRAIAFDTFREMFAPRHEDEKPSNKYHRLAFVTGFLDSRRTGMNHLYKDTLYEYRLRFMQFLTGILPSLSEMNGPVIKDKDILRDLMILKSAYGSYLSRNGLFEPGWEPHSLEISGPLEGRYILVGYDSDIQMQMLMRELGEVPWIGHLDKDGSGDTRYMKFFTEEAELESLFRRLHQLKEQGVPMEDIILSTPEADALRPRLERRSLEFGIPLSFMKSLMLPETVPGRYLFAVRRCLNENLSFRSMENLLLNAAFPFTDMEANRFIIRHMIDSNIRGGSLDFSDDVLFSELKRAASRDSQGVAARAFGLYRDFKSAMTAIRRADDGDELIRDIHGLTTLLFGDGEFSSTDPRDRDVYSFMFSELAGISSVLKQTGLVMKDMFSVFMNEVEHLSYVEQEKKNGIRVYAYGQDYLMDVPWHFVFGLNEANSLVQKKALQFLEDHEVDRGRDTYDVTDRVLACYTSSGDNVWISGSAVSFSGAQSTPPFFILNDSVDEIPGPGTEELSERADAVSLDAARSTFMGEKGPDLAVSGSGPAADISKIRLSYTSISNYARCPYRAFLEFDLSRTPKDFEPSRQDDLKIGSFLHGVIQSFMELHFGQTLTEQHLDEYHEEIEGIMRSRLEAARDFDDVTKQCIYGNYLDPVKSVLTGLLVRGKKAGTGYVGPFVPLRNEYPLDGDPAFTGSVDTIIRDTSGDLYFLDYKKGGGDATYQLVLYRRLYSLKPEFGDDVNDCFFYSMRDSRFKGLAPAKWAEQEQKLDHDIDALRAGYSAGDWKATPSKEACARCEDRGICRRRFNLQ